MKKVILTSMMLAFAGSGYAGPAIVQLGAALDTKAADTEVLQPSAPEDTKALDCGNNPMIPGCPKFCHTHWGHPSCPPPLYCHTNPTGYGCPKAMDKSSGGAAPGARAGCVVYKGHAGYVPAAHVENGVVYKGRYGYDAAAHLNGPIIYRGQYGRDAVAHLAGNTIYKGAHGGSSLGRLEGGLIHKGPGYNVIAHGEGCSAEELAAAGAALILGLL